MESLESIETEDYVIINEKKNTGRPRGSHWKHFEQSNNTRDGHSRAVCKFCGNSWYKGEKAILKGHIANHCKNASTSIIRKYLTKLAENSTGISSNNKKRKLNNCC